MREIKFRVWNIKKKKFYDWETISGAKGTGVWLWFNSNKDGSKNIIEQYTGLKDKNGVEIYEGDIIKADTGLVLRVEDQGTAVVLFDGLKFYGLFHNFEPFYFEVVGNIHENVK